MIRQVYPEQEVGLKIASFCNNFTVHLRFLFQTGLANQFIYNLSDCVYCLIKLFSNGILFPDLSKELVECTVIITHRKVGPKFLSCNKPEFPLNPWPKFILVLLLSLNPNPNPKLATCLGEDW